MNVFFYIKIRLQQKKLETTGQEVMYSPKTFNSNYMDFVG